MKRKSIGVIVTAALAVSLLAAPSAMAATQVGDGCSAVSTIGSNVTAFQFKKGNGNPLPIEAPVGGVLTSWTVNSSIPADLPQQLKVLRPAGNPKLFSTIAESDGTVRVGQNTFESRIPVQAGDRFALAAGATSTVIYCTTANPADEMGYLPVNAAVGSTNEYTPVSGYRIPVVATIEPDADNDGFGDETQDKCPRSAAIQQVACPVITLGAFGRVKTGSAQILVSASSQAQVTVFGTVTIPKKGKKGKARQLTIQGGTQSVSAGAVVPFNLIFPPALKSALANRAPGRSLPLVVTASTTDVAGQSSSHQLTLKLKGQKKGKKAKGKGKAKGKAKKG